MDTADKEALRLMVWQLIQEFNEGGNPADNPEYVRGQVELFLDLCGREDESEYKEELIAAVFDGDIEDPDAVMWTPKDFDSLARAQGWDANSLTNILRGFVRENGLSDKLSEYAAGIADTENAG